MNKINNGIRTRPEKGVSATEYRVKTEKIREMHEKGGLEMILYRLGRILGILIVLFFGMASMNLVVKWIHRTYGDSMKKNRGFYEKYTSWMRFFVKYHRVFGAMAVLFMLIHFGVQYYNLGFSPSGALAAALLLLQALLGGYGSRNKTGEKGWLKAHRVIPVLLLFAMGNHIL